MQLIYNEDQQILKESAQEFFTSKLPITNLRQLRDTKNEVGYDLECWKNMVELGWSAVTIPEQYGGLEFGFKGLGVIFEQSGKTLAASPLLSNCALGTTAVLASTNESLRERILPEVASGEKTLALALEEQVFHAPYQVATTIKADGDDYIISGHKQFVLDGHIADDLVVVCRSSGKAGEKAGITLALVSATADGVKRERKIMADSRNAASIEFDQVRITTADLLGTVGEGADILEFALDVGRICLAAEMHGSLAEAFDRTLAYLKTREQFDVPIGSFQALKHRAARMFCAVEMSKSVVMAGLDVLDSDPTPVERAKHASLAKGKVSEVAKLISDEMIQMHGGIGMTDESEVGFFLKRARVAALTLGDQRFHRDRWGELHEF